MNSLPLSPVVISLLTQFYLENRWLQILLNTVELNSYLGFSALRKSFFFLVCKKFDKGGNSLPKHFERTANIRLNLKFRCFHETKQTQNEVGRFFHNLAQIVFEYLSDSRRIYRPLQSFVSIRFSQRDRTVTQIPNTSSIARSRSPLSPIHAFLTRRNFANTSPVRSFSCAYEVG